MQAAKQALASLKRSAARPNDDLKARAREKLESIKQRLQQLRMMGGTPRQIAALAKELKEAVKAYGAAGGSSAEVAASPADTAQPAEAVSADAAPGEAPSDATQDGAEPSTTPAAAPGADAAQPANSPEGRDPERPAENPYDKAIAAHAESVAAAARKSAEGQEDRDFMMKARQLATHLKAAAAQAAQKARQSGRTADATDAAEATKAAEDADKAIGDIRQSLDGGAFLALGSVSV